MNKFVLSVFAGVIHLASTGLAVAEPQYLAFQIFQGGPDPAIPFDRVMVYTPKEKIAAVAHEIVATIGVGGGDLTKLAIILGPISFDHTDAEARQIIDDGFAIAAAENIAIGFHIDDAMFWSRRIDLMTDPANVEWTNFSGKPATGLKLDWSHPPARMCFNAPAIQAEVTRRAREVIGAEISSQRAILKAQGKADIFAGVIAGWESHMGQDVVTASRVGFHALSNRGFGPGHPPADVNAEVASIVAEFIGRWTIGLAQAGIDPAQIYTHVNFLTKATFEQATVPPEVTYPLLVNSLPSSQQPAVAFAPNSRPGFSTYPVLGVLEQVEEERSLHGQPAWASSEGTNLIPPGPAGNSHMSMETYLARCFNHGATLVNIYSWGVGGPGVANTDPFRIVTQGPEAVATYRKFLTGQKLVEAAVNRPPRASPQNLVTPEATATSINLAATDPDGDKLTYAIVAKPIHGTLAGTGPNRTYTPAPNYSGPDRFTFTASDGVADSNSAAVTLLMSPAHFTSWQNRYFTAEQLTNSLLSGLGANPTRDGMSNLLKYAFGLNPGVPDLTHAPAFTIQKVSGSRYLQVSYRKQQSALDLRYTVQVSNDLVIWKSDLAETVLVSQSDNGDGTDQVIVRDQTATSSQSRHFMRLLVTQP